jgi:hypothetical protein
MATFFDVDILNAELEDFRGPLEKQLSQEAYVFERMRKMAKVTNDHHGTYATRPISTGSPSKGTGIFSGDETLDLTRYTNKDKYELELGRIVVPCTIPIKVANLNKGRNGALKLIDEYVLEIGEYVPMDFNKFILGGTTDSLVLDAADLEGFLTMSVEHTTGRGRGLDTGVISFVAPGSQSGVVQNVSRSQANGVYTQFGDAHWSGGSGKKTLRKVYRQCAHHSGMRGKGPDLVVMDSDTFGNYDDDKEGSVRLQLINDQEDGGNKLLTENVLGQATVIDEPMLDVSVFSGNASDGLAYILTMRHWEMFIVEDWSFSDFTDKVANADGLVAKAAFQGGWMCRRLPAQGAYTGGAA